MEKNVNKGSVTVELAIVLPGIIVLVTLLILIWLKTFQYNHGILQSHQQSLANEVPRTVHIENHWYQSFELHYDYEPVKIEMTQLQRHVDYILYLVFNYYERLGGDE